jgi:hypothetical protein
MPTPSGLSGTLWPIHPQLFPDELLLSWMVRIARAHGCKPTLFWKRKVPSINFRTVDRRPDEALLKLLSAKTGTPPDRVEAAAVPMYENFGVCRKDRNDDVLVYCPACLNEGAYFRRCWRLEFFLLCDIHGVLLHDSCPACRGLVRLEQLPLDAKSLATCHGCGFDLSKAELKCSGSEVEQGLLVLEQRLARVFDGPAERDGHFIFSATKRII